MTAGARAVAAGRNSPYAWTRLAVSVVIMMIGAAGMFTVVVALKPVALTFAASRADASLPYMLTMIGFGVGGIVMGRLSDRFGVMAPVAFGGVCLGTGFILAASATSLWQFSLAQGLLIGLCGSSATFAPLVADISHWFGRHRGLAVAIVISGNYLGGTVWPPIVQHFFDSVGWRDTYVGLGVFCLVTILPLCLVLYRRTPRDVGTASEDGAVEPGRPLGMAPATLQCVLCAAGVGCCIAMAMPQVHIVAYATDLGHAAARGAEMLALMLGFGVVSRIGSGAISDRIGGVRTLLLGSGLQALALALFIPADSLTGLYLMSVLFGLSQGGIVPSYAIIIRDYFPPGQAGWRIGAVLSATLFGMAAGGWMAGALYDLTGSYDAAFVNAIGFNIVNMAIAITLLRRSRQRLAIPT